MVHQLLPDVPRTIFRPAIVMGDSRRTETSQFDMVQAFDVLARLPVLPLRPNDRIDIVPANYVAKAIVTIHQKPAPAHGIYHLSSGEGSQTYREITTALAAAGRGHRPAFVPSLGKPFSATVDRLAHGSGSVGRGASLLKVFWPYLDWNTVFDNSRVVAELAESPAKFSSYAYPLSKVQPRKQISLSSETVALVRAGRAAIHRRRERPRMTDFLLVAWVSALIEIRRFAWMFGLGRRWTPGEKLRLFFAGYNGTRNTRLRRPRPGNVAPGPPRPRRE